MFAGFLFAVSRDPGLLADERFLSETDRELANKDMAMAIEKNGSLAYLSPSLAQPDNGVDLLQLLNRNVDEGESKPSGSPWMNDPSLKPDGTSYEVDRQTLALSRADGQKQTVYLLTDRGGTAHFFHTFVPLLFLSFLLGIALTSGLL